MMGINLFVHDGVVDNVEGTFLYCLLFFFFAGYVERFRLIKVIWDSVESFAMSKINNMDVRAQFKKFVYLPSLQQDLCCIQQVDN